MKIRSGTSLGILSCYLFMVLVNCFCFSEAFLKENAWLAHIAKHLPLEKHISWKMTGTCKCGVMPINQTEERIVGGIVTKPNAWPWMGAIVHIGDGKPKILCGASVINTLYLLTAAHCVDFLKTHGIRQFKIFLGTNDLNDEEAVIPEIDSVILHPRYNSKFKAFDIGLIKLKYRLKFSSKVAPICITPQTGVPYVDKEAIVSGWGTTMFGGQPATMQMQAMVNVTTNRSCQKKYDKSDEPVKIIASMLCASSPGSDSCQGDSGGPLFTKRKGSKEIYEQIGIVAFGSGCADSKFDGVYTRVGKFLSFIKSATKDAVYCHPK